jgi:hypothetical protein
LGAIWGVFPDIGAAGADGTGSSPPPAAALAAAGPLPRHSNRPSLLILGTHGLSEDQGGYLVFTGPRRLRLLQKTQ